MEIGQRSPPFLGLGTSTLCHLQSDYEIDSLSTDLHW